MSKKTKTMSVLLLSVHGTHRPGEIVSLPEAEALGLLATDFARLPDGPSPEPGGPTAQEVAEIRRRAAEAESGLSGLRKRILALDPKGKDLAGRVSALQAELDPERADGADTAGDTTGDKGKDKSKADKDR